MSMEPEVLTEWFGSTGITRYRIARRFDEYGSAVHSVERMILGGEWQILDLRDPHRAAALVTRLLQLSPPLQITRGHSPPRGSFTVTDGA